jgi:hypothetical protein
MITMRAVRLPAQVTKEHTLLLQLPEDIREGPAEVIVLVPENGERLHGQDPMETAAGGSLAEFLDDTRNDLRFVRSKLDLDDYLRAERESWE